MTDEMALQGPSEAGTPEGRWGTPLGLAGVSSALAAALLLGTAVVGFRVDPDDDANYIVTALAAIIASLNVLFTLWLLRTAQRQLGLMRKQAMEQREDSSSQIAQLRESHDAERHEATEQLDSLREQLKLAQDSHAAERDEATKSLAISETAFEESLKSRLDQSAPRVSLSVEDTRLVLHKRQNDGNVATTKEISGLDEVDGLAGYWLEVVFRFSLRNWGTEPVATTLSSPWEKYENHLLFPGDPWVLQHAFRVQSINFREVAESGIKQNDQKSEWIFPVVVSDLGGQVSDYHVWRVHPMPLRIELGKIVRNPDWERSYRKFATRERRYNSLDRRDLAAGKELDGPQI